jgi:signal transduction histidine kinase
MLRRMSPPVRPYVVLSVADTGTGMPPAIMEKIFERVLAADE